MDKDYARSEAFVLHLLERLGVDLEKPPWNPNSGKLQSGADVALALSDNRLIGVQVTEIDPFPKPGRRGRERARIGASATGVVGDYGQNDTAVVLDAICRTVERKARITPDKSQFGHFWLLMGTGVPDAPTSTFIPTPPLAAADLDIVTKELLSKSAYGECFLMPLLSMEQAIYRWSRNGTRRWQKDVYLKEIPYGTRDEEYVRELVRTRGKDKTVVNRRVKEILNEITNNAIAGP